MRDDEGTIERGLRVCLVIEKLAERSGGAERVMIEVANELAARGHIVDVLSHEFRGRPPFYPLDFGVVPLNLRRQRMNRTRLRRHVDRVRDHIHQSVPDLPPPLDRALWLSRNGGFWRRLEEYLKIYRPDVAIAFMPPAIIALGLAEPGYELRRIASMHNAPEQDFCNPERWDPSALDRRRRLKVLGVFDQVTVLLPEYHEWFPSHLHDRIRVIPNAVRPVDNEQIARTRRTKVVMSVGRLSEVKRHALLIDAWVAVARTFPDWRLQIYGVGPLQADLAGQIERLGLKHSVRLMGHVRDIQERYLNASFLVHPAAYEGFPLAVTEALAAGMPVVGFEDCSGLNRLVTEGVNGRLVKADGDRTANFTAALLDMMASPELRSRLSSAAPDAVAPYQPEIIYDLWDDAVRGNR